MIGGKITLQRGCSEDLSDGFTVSPGQAGEGAYFFLPSMSMRRYYGQKRNIVTVEVDADAYIIDFTFAAMTDELINFAKEYFKNQKDLLDGNYTIPKINKRNYQCFGQVIAAYIDRNIERKVDGYIVNHQGIGIPKGKQAIILNQDVLTTLPRKENHSEMSYL